MNSFACVCVYPGTLTRRIHDAGHAVTLVRLRNGGFTVVH